MNAHQALNILVKRLTKYVEKNGTTEYAREQAQILDTLLLQNRQAQQAQSEIEYWKNKCKILCALNDITSDVIDIPNEFLKPFAEDLIFRDGRASIVNGKELFPVQPPENIQEYLEHIFFFWQLYIDERKFYYEYKKQLAEFPTDFKYLEQLESFTNSLVFIQEIESRIYDPITR